MFAREKIQRFNSLVVRGRGRNACWLWAGPRLKRKNGDLSYGYISIAKYHVELAHRFAWQLRRGRIPKDRVICHRCDNPACVRLSHLFVGTQADNLKDMRSKGRGYPNFFPFGEAHPNAKLDEDAVRKIRRLHATKGWSCMRLGVCFDVSASTIHQILTRKTWSEVPDGS